MHQLNNVSPNSIRRCKKCCKSKSGDTFRPGRSSCILCERKIAHDRYHEDLLVSRALARARYFKRLLVKREIGRRSYNKNTKTARKVKQRNYYRDVEFSRERARKGYHVDVRRSRMRARLNAHNRQRRYNPKNKLYSAKRYELLKKGPPMTPILYAGTFDENRKRYGVLTCWICFNPIVGETGQLEHDLEPCRGGLNTKDNLGVAHASCNRSKGRRTRAEYWAQEFPGAIV